MRLPAAFMFSATRMATSYDALVVPLSSDLINWASLIKALPYRQVAKIKWQLGHFCRYDFSQHV